MDNQVNIDELTEVKNKLFEAIDPLASLINERNGLAPKVSNEAAQIIRDSVVKALSLEQYIVELEAKIDELSAIKKDSKLDELEDEKNYWKAQYNSAITKESMVDELEKDELYKDAIELVAKLR